MATLIKQTEALPAAYPAIGGLSDAARALGKEIIWQRLEPYIVTRYSERAVEWIAEGPGEWVPPLSPATIATVQVWSRAGVWETATLCASPLGGYWLPCTGPYRFTAIAGSDDDPPPVAVREAFRRLAEYLVASPGKPGATTESVSIGEMSRSIRRDASWMAQALQNSGAADLLRPYRKV